MQLPAQVATSTVPTPESNESVVAKTSICSSAQPIATGVPVPFDFELTMKQIVGEITDKVISGCKRPLSEEDGRLSGSEPKRLRSTS